MWILAAAFAASLVASASPATAQDTGAGTPSPRGRAGRMDRFDPTVLKGPPAAEEFAKIAGLEEAQRERYAGLQQQFMANTQPQRDSLNAIVTAAREAFQRGDRQGARARRSTMRNLRNGLVERQKEFDASVQQLINPDQWAKYEKWREQERERVRKEWRERRGHPA